MNYARVIEKTGTPSVQHCWVIVLWTSRQVHLQKRASSSSYLTVARLIFDSQWEHEPMNPSRIGGHYGLRAWKRMCMSTAVARAAAAGAGVSPSTPSASQ